MVALILQRERQIVMRFRVVGFEVQRLMIARNGLVPGFVARKLDSSLTVTLGCLRKRRRCEREAQEQQKHRGPILRRKLKELFHSGIS